ASVGHGILCIFSHNWWYGSALNRHAMDVMQYLHALVAVAGPIAIWWFFGFDLTVVFRLASEPLGWIGGAYLVLCWTSCFVLLPSITVWCLVRPKAAALLEERSEVVNVAAQLGFKPVGQGKQALLARLP